MGKRSTSQYAVSGDALARQRANLPFPPRVHLAQSIRVRTHAYMQKRSRGSSKDVCAHVMQAAREIDVVVVVTAAVVVVVLLLLVQVSSLQAETIGAHMHAFACVRVC